MFASKGAMPLHVRLPTACHMVDQNLFYFISSVTPYRYLVMVKGGGVLYVVLGMGRVTLHIKFLKRSFIKVSYTKYSINSRELTTFENHTLECKTIGLIKESCFCANIFLIFKMACVAYITIMEFLRRGESITLGAIIGWRGRGALKHLCTITKLLQH